MRSLKSEEAAAQPYEEVAACMSTDLKDGLTWREAECRLRIFGLNELIVEKQEPIWAKYIEQVRIGKALPHSPFP